jgi:nucleotide-binding universal stress UspA family protein
MSRPILVGHDPQRPAHGPLDFGAAMAKVTRAALIIVCVRAAPPLLPLYGSEELPYAIADRNLAEDCSAAMDEVDADMRAAGVPYETRTLEGTSAARALQVLAEEEQAGLIVLGAGRAAADGRLGGSPTSLLHGAPCPVAAVPPSWTPGAGLRTVGVGYVDSEEARRALADAYALARRAGAALRVITVMKGGADDLRDHRGRVEEEVHRALPAHDGDVAVEVEAVTGDPADGMIAASERVDVLVLGSRGYGPLRAVLLGSVSRRVTREARCPVIVLPRGVRASLDALLAETPHAATPA